MTHYPKIVLHSVKTEGDKVTVCVEHHPAQSYSRAVGPAANRIVMGEAAHHFRGARHITRTAMDHRYGDSLTAKREGQVVSAYVYEVTR